MSLNGALQIGRSAITASQAALQVAGNNMANAATPGFHRRAMTLSPLQGELLGRGIEVGRGVNLTSVKRVVDIAMQSRHRLALSREHGAMVDQRFLRSLETIQNELTGNDLSSELSAFFNAFSELANNPTDNAVRAVVIQQGVSVADRISAMQREYGTVINEIDRSIGATIETVNDLLSRIESVNQQIVITEPVAGEAASLRDQRDGLLDELSQYVDINVIEQSSGGIDIHIGSTPIFLGGASRGIELRQTTVGGAVETSIRVAADGTTLKINEGELGALMRQRTEHVNPAMATLDEFASQLIFQVNKLHGQGQPMSGLTSASGTYGILDSTANLNASAAGLPFRIENGSFQIHVTHAESGARDATQVEIDGNAMSLDDLIAEINTNVPNITASTGPAGELVLTASGGYELSFSDDTSGALAALGVNSFFSGHNASTIGVRKALVSDPTLLAADADHLPGSGGTALAITGLQEQAIDDLNGVTLRDFWRNHVNGVAVRTNAADNNVQSARLVKDNLNAQMQATSGVSLDEESINLLTFQRQFQAAARYISVIDDTLQTLLSMT